MSDESTDVDVSYTGREKACKDFLNGKSDVNWDRVAEVIKEVLEAGVVDNICGPKQIYIGIREAIGSLNPHIQANIEAHFQERGLLPDLDKLK